jgi:hypothetical protein
MMEEGVVEEGLVAEDVGREGDAPASLSTEQRLCIFYGTSLASADALALPLAELRFEAMRAHGCVYQAIAAAGLRPRALYAMGFESARHFRQVGMDALDLADWKVSCELVALFGAPAIKEAFLATASDAVAFAGTESARLLQIDLDESLALCAGEPESARAVLELQADVVDALRGTSADRLLDTGIRAEALAAVGVTLATLTTTLYANAAQVQQLGYAVRLV